MRDGGGVLVTGEIPEAGRTPRHRSTGRRRGVATWVWAAPLAVVVIVALVLGWFTLSRGAGDGDVSDCLAGDLDLVVWADPAAEPTARELVDTYAATDPVVRDHCIHARVEVMDTASADEAYRSATAAGPSDGTTTVAPVWLPVGTGLTAGLAGAPEVPPVVGSTVDGQPVPLVVFGSSPAVPEDQARAGADFARVVAGG